MSEILLYDLPSKGRCACWSYNPWKTRLFLNFKGVPYTTQWIEYPDIAPTFKSFNIPQNEEGTPYTIPAIRMGADKYIMDSHKIAAELEQLYPSPSLHLDSPILLKVYETLRQAIAPLRGFAMPKVPHTILNQASVDYWNETRAKAFGKPLPQLEQDTNVDEAWEKATPAIKDFGTILRAEDGPFVLGKTVSYADFVIVGGLQFMKRIDQGIYDRAVMIEPALKDLYEASKPWLERDGH